jgi:4,5-DOPA dioxygenase extradiol
MTPPAVFVSHGAPSLALDRDGGADFARLGASLGRPAALLVVSAHWQATPPALGTRTRRPLVYDFAGFPAELYEVRYDPSAAPALAERVTELVPEIRDAPTRGLDHGVWVPLVHMFPAADVPVLQMSLPSGFSPRALFELGRRLRPLRDDGIVVLGSGGLVHDFGSLDWRGQAPPAEHALRFERWVRARLDAGDVEALVAFRERAPDARRAHPTDEHFLPLLVALGAAGDDVAAVRYPIEGHELGSLSRPAS